MKLSQSQQIIDQTRDNYNTIAHKFDQTRTFVPKPLTELIERAVDLVEGPLSILDVGCGNGRISQLFPSKTDYLGIDPSEKMIELAKQHYPKRHFQTIESVYQPDLPNNYFSLILCLAVVHHLPTEKERKKFISRLFTLAGPGGVLLLTVWNPEAGLAGDQYIPFDNGSERIQRFVHCFTLSELVATIDSGFQIIQNGTQQYGLGGKTNNLFILAKKSPAR